MICVMFLKGSFAEWFIPFIFFIIIIFILCIYIYIYIYIYIFIFFVVTTYLAQYKILSVRQNPVIVQFVFEKLHNFWRQYVFKYFLLCLSILDNIGHLICKTYIKHIKYIKPFEKRFHNNL